MLAPTWGRGPASHEANSVTAARRSLLRVGLLALGTVVVIDLLFHLGLQVPSEIRERWVKAQAAFGRTPDIQGDFDVFLEGGALTYLREPCELADTEARFFLHVVPVSMVHLPATRRGFGFDNLDFNFAEHGRLSDGSCTVTAPLPLYPFEHISTGQFDRTGQLWAGAIALPHSGRSVRLDQQAFEPGATVRLSTQIYVLDVAAVGLEPFATDGGAIEPVGDGLLVATPRGRLAMIDRDGQVTYLEGGVPMNEAGFLASGMQDDPAVVEARFRVMDILVRDAADGHYDLFATHHFFDGSHVRVRLSAGTLKMVDGRLEASPTWRSVFDAKPRLALPFKGNEAGGRMLADGPGHLLVTIGNHGRDLGEPGSPAPPQDAGLHLGKVLRVDLATGEAEVHTLGHRNQQGLTRDRHGNVWLTEHGDRGGDELNLIEPGGNYGWPAVSYGHRHGRMALKPDDAAPGHHEGFVAPTFAWVPSIAVSAIVANDETAFPLWRDDLLIAALGGMGMRGQSLYRVRHQARQVKYVERIEIGHRIRDLAHGPEGSLALLLDMGRVLLVRRSDFWCGKAPPGYVPALHCVSDATAADDAPAAAVAPDPLAGRPVAATAPPLSAEAREGRRLYGQHCGACHHLEEERHGPGPHLVGILGRRTGAATIDSPSLAALDAIWDEANLQRFILDPADFAPGTAMPSGNLSAAEARVIVGYIAERNAALASR